MIPRQLQRWLASDATRSSLYGVAGAALFFVVLMGFLRAIDEARTPMVEQFQRTAAPQPAAAPTELHVPPAGLEFPIY